jgi:dTDP-4-dehydrorhamnose reductase
VILATGAGGQVGSVLARTPGVVAIDIDALDLATGDPGPVLDRLAPSAVINTAAYTGVDRAEVDRDLAFAINATGAGRLAEACAARGIRMIQISTDYVFDGASARPYREDDPTGPINTYGASKLAGEDAVRAAGGTVMRTSWVFSSTGANFVKTIVRLATERPELRIVADQRGCPTHAAEVARLALALVAQPAGTYHACGDGPTTWHGFAQAIVDAARPRRALACERVVPIATADYPTPARRPLMSILDTAKVRALGIVPAPWTIGLQQAIEELLP